MISTGTNDVFFNKLTNEDDIDEHIFQIYSESGAVFENRGLGFISKDVFVQIELHNGDELIIEQSITCLSGKESSSTGFAAWKVSPLFAEWLLYHKNQPFQALFSQIDSKNILELGSGVSGILASTIGKKCNHFIATDQRHILKLLKKNILNNVDHFKSTTIDKNITNNSSNQNVVEFDWENLEQGIYNTHHLALENSIDLILACDTIYNEYLIPFFINSVAKLATENTIILIAIHLRDCEIVESFLKSSLPIFDCYNVKNEFLTSDLQKGYSIYYFKKK
ncbi:hypothetical protein PACTADRAFT_1046 [Pachysolen tannophilus NRRL Y-2460]|uniref:Ribosomal lysine N-methyltransferase 5 n=1 Tax=Pachysolen tannophilus NRRL Y-2460 TaxID=669874 RepID=A0A1E4U3K8_PACTA|nr:hypothetical protein PACTADRAFT_1046 [Pachysolen tannophilus NRRL Y-2460]